LAALDERLKDLDYTDTLNFALDAGLEKQTELTDKRAFWDWLKFCGRSAAIETSKRAARERRTERKRTLFFFLPPSLSRL
jgi:hypothetical protein